MFHTELVEKIRTHMSCSVTFSWRFCSLWDNVERYGRTREASDDSIVWCICFACWITKATDSHSEYVILLLYCNSAYMNVPECYGIFTWPVLFFFCTENSHLTCKPITYVMVVEMYHSWWLWITASLMCSLMTIHCGFNSFVIHFLLSEVYHRNVAARSEIRV